MNVYEMSLSLKKTCLNKISFKEISFQIFLKHIQIWRCFNIARQHVPKSGRLRRLCPHNASMLMVVRAGGHHLLIVMNTLISLARVNN